MFRCANEQRTVGNPNPKRCKAPCPSCRIWNGMTKTLTYICPKCKVRWKIVPSKITDEVKILCSNCDKE